MTQGGMRAYGASARPAPALETPPLLHYILPLTREGQLQAPSSSLRLIRTLFGAVLTDFPGRKLAVYIYLTSFTFFFYTTGIYIKPQIKFLNYKGLDLRAYNLPRI